ncbi:MULTISPECIES: undecaprenyl-diphosphatase [Bacillaceae]|uniref:undecaprenyl-diphosphatase n=1 Tax=Bacillaceae TaxID=186817 RepID=UPI002FFE6C8E
MLSHLDYSSFQLINHMAISDQFLNPFMIMLAEKAQYLFFLGIIIYWFFQKKKNNRRMVIEAIISAGIALGLNVLIGLFIYRDRPFVTHHVNWLIPHVKNDSFPSDHATAAFVIATAIWIWRKGAGWLWLLLAAGIALSRVWTGVHYPLDVIAGMVIGVGTALLVHTILARWQWGNRMIQSIIAFYEKLEHMLLKRKSISR